MGATYQNGTAEFVVWAPLVTAAELHLVAPSERLIPMEARANGYFGVTLKDVLPGTRYFYRLNGSTDRPDPASRKQPEGVHGPSELLPAHNWIDEPEWRGLPLEQYVFYELHVGTFTAEGTLDAVIPHLDRLIRLGITAIELMPLAAFPGDRNWGYDGVYPFAVHTSYGGVEALRRLVQACHARGLAVVLDVVYNHLGPEGNYLREFGPYFTDQHKTGWGEAINFDGPDSDHVRRFFLDNALYWIESCGIDALRLDAVHAIHDRSAYPFLQELADTVHERAAELGRRVYLIAESDLNDARVVTPSRAGGLGLDAQWADDLHHCLHALLTGERAGYYQDFYSLTQLATALQNGWVYAGQYSPLRQRRFGNSPRELAGRQFVVCTQNHDQIGNRMLGERLIHLVGADKARLAAAAVILSPFLPLLFMGEEYGETAPFLYHVSHSDPSLVEAVRRGRKQEFAAFCNQGEPPDPQAPETFERSKLSADPLSQESASRMHRYYEALLRLRRTHGALSDPRKDQTVVECDPKSNGLIVRRLFRCTQVIMVLHFGDSEETVSVYLPRGEWHTALNSASAEWGGADARVPVSYQSTGEEVLLTMSPWSALVLVEESAG